MGQCSSRKNVGGVLAVSSVMCQSSTSEENNIETSPSDDKQSLKKPPLNAASKGVAMSFGFRKKSALPTYTGNPAAARRLATNETSIDKNGNDDINSVPPSGRSTPRLVPPKKEPHATRVSRFGFRQPNNNRLNKIADVKPIEPTHLQFNKNENNNLEIPPTRNKVTFSSSVDNNQRIKKENASATKQPTKFTLQTGTLPKPQSICVIETKTTKTLVNNNRKGTNQKKIDENKDGSMTEDSGVSSNQENDNSIEVNDEKKGVHVLEDLKISQTIINSNEEKKIGEHQNEIKDDQNKTRNIEKETRYLQKQIRNDQGEFRNDRKETRNDTPNGTRNIQREIKTFNKLELKQKPRNLDVLLKGNTFDLRDLDTTLAEEELPLPCLPTAFQPNHSGIVKERAMEYERNLEKRNSLERSDKKSFTPISRFLKHSSRADSSPSSSDDQMWGNAAGEAMADDFSCSLSSSDESKDVANIENDPFKRLLTASFSSTLPKNEIRNVLLTIEDPKFAAVAAASKSSKLIEDEPSPTESLIYSYSEAEDYRKKSNRRRSSSISKDVCEKNSPSSSPGTPTNASNSLSLSDGKDFLIDDEIADQPALIFDDAQPNSENNTLIERTPKVTRRALQSIEHSPLFLKSRKKFLSRSDSVETLSTCESITSDDLMLDYDVSQDIGVEDRLDIRSCDGSSLNLDRSDVIKDWSLVVGQLDKQLGKHVGRSRLLRSRGGTPDSTRSLEGRNVRSRSSIAQSPLRLQSPRILAIGSPAGYESDDSIRMDRSCHSAMVQEVMGMKTMLLKLKRVLQEQGDEDVLMRSETHNLFETQRNGLFNGLCSEIHLDDPPDYKIENDDLKRQVLFLQGQVEDKQRTIHELQEQMDKLADLNFKSNSAPESCISIENSNAATQTERMRLISPGASVLSVSSDAGDINSVVSVNEKQKDMKSPQRSRIRPPTTLWRTPGDAPTPLRYTSRSSSRNRRPPTPSS